MKERPIIFSAPMVRAILDGRKTQTRRIVNKAIPVGHKFHGFIIESTDKKRDGCAAWGIGDDALTYDLIVAKCPYGKPGDPLWLRETWCGPILDDEEYEERKRDGVERFLKPDYCVYKATDQLNGIDEDNNELKWRPSIHMPRWASRILLEVVNVRVERLQDISEEDAMAEGAHPIDFGYGDCYELGYKQLWESINGLGSWDLNPWVWVVEFRRI